jgi:transposase-like protein
MPGPYDTAFRGRAVAAYEAGEGGYHELAALFGLGYRTLQRWVAQYRATESVAPRPRGGGWRSPIDPIVLHAVVRECPDGTSEELSREYNRRVGGDERTSATSFRRALRRERYVVKKNGAVQVNATDPTFSAVARPFAGRFRRSTRAGWSRSTKRG